MTENERIKAVSQLHYWKRDPTIAHMIEIVCRAWAQPDIGHLARYVPDSFDELYEEAEAMQENDG